MKKGLGNIDKAFKPKMCWLYGYKYTSLQQMVTDKKNSKNSVSERNVLGLL